MRTSKSGAAKELCYTWANWTHLAFGSVCAPHELVVPLQRSRPRLGLGSELLLAPRPAAHGQPLLLLPLGA
ncbi:hypothetical protein COP2_037436 [Malus domestica]